MREVLLNICITSLALCLFKMLVPEGALKKQTDFLVACFFLSSIVFFFTNGRVNFASAEDFLAGFSAEDISYADFSESYANAQKNALEREVRSALFRVLDENGIYPEEISVSVNISDKYSISINEIRLVLVSPEPPDSPDLIKPELPDNEGEEDGGGGTPPELEILKKAIHIVQKEVGGNILVTGELKHE